jgi:hypothetical protein
MSRELRISSLYHVPPEPVWLRRLQIGGLISQIIAVALLWCRMAFGIHWPNRVTYDIVIFVLLAANIAVQLRVWRYQRSRKKA